MDIKIKFKIERRERMKWEEIKERRETTNIKS